MVAVAVCAPIELCLLQLNCIPLVARIASRIEGTPVSASTIHNLFDMDNTYASKLDFSKGNTE